MRALTRSATAVAAALLLSACVPQPPAQQPEPTTIEQLEDALEREGVVDVVEIEVVPGEGQPTLEVRLSVAGEVDPDAVASFVDALLPRVSEMSDAQPRGLTRVSVATGYDSVSPGVVVLDDLVGLEHLAAMLDAAATSPCASLRVLEDATVGRVLSIDCEISFEADAIAGAYEDITAIAVESPAIGATQWRAVSSDGDAWELDLRVAPLPGRGELLAEVVRAAEAEGVAWLGIQDDGEAMLVTGEADSSSDAACDAIWQILDEDAALAYPPSVSLSLPDGAYGSVCSRVV